MAFLYGFAVVAGLLNALQSGANSTLAKTLGQPFAAALVIVAVSATGLLVAGLVSGQLHLPEAQGWRSVPWWGWIGGLMGAVFVMSQLLVAQRIGAAPYLGLTVTAAVIGSLVLDHFGLMGFKQHAAGWGRLAGAALMIAGVGLIARS
ncbi:MAG TPA: DMT family transporter [Beijerinckiaceae bacterium]|jgi:transporter family-2 protein